MPILMTSGGTHCTATQLLPKSAALTCEELLTTICFSRDTEGARQVSFQNVIPIALEHDQTKFAIMETHRPKFSQSRIALKCHRSDLRIPKTFPVKDFNRRWNLQRLQAAFAEAFLVNVSQTRPGLKQQLANLRPEETAFPKNFN
jgi:hypothetical protein